MVMIGILDPDPHENLSGSETLVSKVLNIMNNITGFVRSS